MARIEIDVAICNKAWHTEDANRGEGDGYFWLETMPLPLVLEWFKTAGGVEEFGYFDL